MKAMSFLARTLLVALYFIGVVSVIWLMLYLVCGVVYVISDAENSGLIARTPRWVFLFSIFALLRYTKPIKRAIDQLA